MFENSVLSKTGQLWKLCIAILLMLIGSFAPLSAGSGIDWTWGTILATITGLLAVLVFTDTTPDLGLLVPAALICAGLLVLETNSLSLVGTLSTEGPATDVAVPRPVNAPGAARRPHWRIG
jgi:hypothetical protein